MNTKDIATIRAYQGINMYMDSAGNEIAREQVATYSPIYDKLLATASVDPTATMHIYKVTHQ